MVLDYLGIGLDEWLQRSPGTHIHPDDSERVKACWNRALGSGSAYDVELRVRKHDGSYRWFLARYNPVRDDKGQIMRWYVAGTDIEDRKQAEDRLRHENVALRRAEEKIREQEAASADAGSHAAARSRANGRCPSRLYERDCAQVSRLITT
jgi:formate hydrogenlyase transcriptional activator